jgi:Rap1a immunity proteins
MLAFRKERLTKPVFCPPQKATNEQFIRVVVAYIDKHPEMTHEPFESLALVALAEAWPCK